MRDNFDNYIFIEDEFTVDRLGNIIVNGEEIARLKIINFENLQAMERLGDSLLNSNDIPSLGIKADKILNVGRIECKCGKRNGYSD